MMKKKAGRPRKSPEDIKERANIRLSKKQKEVLYYGLDRSMGLQTAIDLAIEKLKTLQHTKA